MLEAIQKAKAAVDAPRPPSPPTEYFDKLQLEANALQERISKKIKQAKRKKVRALS